MIYTQLKISVAAHLGRSGGSWRAGRIPCLWDFCCGRLRSGLGSCERSLSEAPGFLQRKTRLLPRVGSFPGGSDSKVPACNMGDLDLIPWSERFPGERNGNPLQYPCLENPMDRGVTKSQTRLSDFPFLFLRRRVDSRHRELRCVHLGEASL